MASGETVARAPISCLGWTWRFGLIAISALFLPIALDLWPAKIVPYVRLEKNEFAIGEPIFVHAGQLASKRVDLTRDFQAGTMTVTDSSGAVMVRSDWPPYPIFWDGWTEGNQDEYSLCLNDRADFSKPGIYTVSLEAVQKKATKHFTVRDAGDFRQVRVSIDMPEEIDVANEGKLSFTISMANDSLAPVFFLPPDRESWKIAIRGESSNCRAESFPFATSLENLQQRTALTGPAGSSTSAPRGSPGAGSSAVVRIGPGSTYVVSASFDFGSPSRQPAIDSAAPGLSPPETTAQKIDFSDFAVWIVFHPEIRLSGDRSSAAGRATYAPLLVGRAHYESGKRVSSACSGQPSHELTAALDWEPMDSSALPADVWETAE